MLVASTKMVSFLFGTLERLSMRPSDGRMGARTVLSADIASHCRTSGVLAALLLAIGMCLPISPGFAAEGTSLTLEKRNVVAAPRSGKIMVLLALQEHRDKLRGLSQPDAERLLGETAKRYLTETFGNERYREVNNAEVIFAFVDNMDEYNRPNFGGMKRIGTAGFQREARSLKQLSLQVDMTVLKQ